MRPLTAEQVIEHLRKQGLLDEEILEHFARFGMAVSPDGTGRLEWDVGPTDTLYQRRILTERLARFRGTRRDDVSEEEVRAERARRKAAGQPHSYAVLARHFNCDQSTIRRRLGVLDPKIDT